MTSLDDVALLKRGLLFKERKGADFFSVRVFLIITESISFLYRYGILTAGLFKL